MSRESDIELAQRLSREGEVDAAYTIASRYLKQDPNDLTFLTVMVYLMLGSDKPAIGYHLAKQACQLAPKEPSNWVNMGMAAQDLWQSREAERAYERGLKVALNDEQRMLLLVNMTALHIDNGRFEEAEKWAKKAVKIDPENQKAQSNLGFCQLAQRKWKEGWKNYHTCLGHEWRPRVNYAGEPEWDGTEKNRVVLYAEQGLGDVLSFASMVPDAQKKAKVVLDVNAGLEGLLQRSFPDASVYGTRMKKQVSWRDEDKEVDASISMGQIGEFFRNSDEDFPGTPYLVPDPDRVVQWKALFKTKKKPVIGIAWRGGIPKTAARYRQWDLEQLLPILKSVDAHWVSLQYKPAGKEIAAFKEKHPEIDIVEYPHGTLTKDYDDTAALVASLDQVVCMQTAVGHLAGGLGIPCMTFIPTTSQWRYGGDSEEFLWAKSVKLMRQTKPKEWGAIINQAAGELSARFPRVSKGTGKAPRKRKLRSNGSAVRANRQSDHRHDGDRPAA